MERQKRLRARNDLLTYASSIEIPGAPRGGDDSDDFVPIKEGFGAHHLLWLDCLQKVADGKIKRLLGMWSPGSAKSSYTSIVFPTFFLGRNPGQSVILASYGTDLPKKFGRKARSIVKSKRYQRIFDCTLTQESSAADEWGLTNGSTWMAAGILTGITGNRADGVIWDDLIKGREQADSLIVRQKTWEAYFDDLLTRKKPHAWEIGISTRWHEDDIAGRVLPADYDGQSGWVKGQDGNDWYVVCLPAICERLDDPLGRSPGDILWPEWFTPEHFAPFQREPRTWSALFQQRPAPDSGDFFKAEWLRPYGTQQAIKRPDISTLAIYGASDYAVTQDAGDYTVHIVVGVDRNSNIWVLDLWRAQASSDVWVESFCDLVKLWKPIGWAEETGQIKAGVGPFLERRMRERKAFVARAMFPSRSSKEIRAQSIRGRIALDGLYVPVEAPWYASFKNELMSFPAGRHDDQVDALSLIGQVLDKMMPGRAPKVKKEDTPVLSMDPEKCTLTLTKLWEENEARSPRQDRLRIN